jgi:hypothetical protein
VPANRTKKDIPAEDVSNQKDVELEGPKFVALTPLKVEDLTIDAGEDVPVSQALLRARDELVNNKFMAQAGTSEAIQAQQDRETRMSDESNSLPFLRTGGSTGSDAVIEENTGKNPNTEADGPEDEGVKAGVIEEARKQADEANKKAQERKTVGGSDDSDGFDPSEHTVDEVIDYVNEHPDQKDAVAEAEEAGKGRVTVLSQLETMGDDDEDED